MNPRKKNGISNSTFAAQNKHTVELTKLRWTLRNDFRPTCFSATVTKLALISFLLVVFFVFLLIQIVRLRLPLRVSDLPERRVELWFWIIELTPRFQLSRWTLKSILTVWLSDSTTVPQLSYRFGSELEGAPIPTGQSQGTRERGFFVKQYWQGRFSYKGYPPKLLFPSLGNFSLFFSYRISLPEMKKDFLGFFPYFVLIIQ